MLSYCSPSVGLTLQHRQRGGATGVTHDVSEGVVRVVGEQVARSQVAERLGNWASNLKVASSIPSRVK